MSKSCDYSKMKNLDSLSKKELIELNDRSFRDLVIGFTLMNAADIFLQRSRRVVEKKKGIVRFREKAVATRQAKLVMDAINEFDYNANVVDDMFYKEDKANGVSGATTYDKIRRNANRFARLVEFYYDRCQDDESAEKVFQLLMSLESKHMFTEEEMNVHLKEKY